MGVAPVRIVFASCACDDIPKEATNNTSMSMHNE